MSSTLSPSCVKPGMRGVWMISGQATDILFFNGWSLGKDFVEGFVRQLADGRSYKIIEIDERFLDDCWMRPLASLVQPNTILAGWSLGGMLAIRFAHYLENSKVPYLKLITLMAAPGFVRSASWPQAMPPELFHAFEESSEDDRKLSKTFPYLMTAHSSNAQRAVDRELFSGVKKHYVDSLQTSSLRARTLALLKNLDVIDELAGLTRPVLMLFGVEDQLVPQASASAVQERFSRHHVLLMDGECHYLNDTVLEQAKGVLEAGIPLYAGAGHV